MRKYIPFIILLMNIVLLNGCSQDVKEYKNLENGYSFSYSTEWEQQSVNGQIVFFLKQKKNAKSSFKNNINILIQDLSKNPMNLESYHRLTKDQIKQALSLNTVESESSISVSGFLAKEIIYSIPQDLAKGRYVDLKLKQVYFIKNNTAYLITYTALKGEFEEYLRSANMVFNTYKVSKR